jgi:hypothetical protein
MTRKTHQGQSRGLLGPAPIAPALGVGRSAIPGAGGSAWTGQVEVAAGLAALHVQWAVGDVRGAMAAGERLYRLDGEDRLVVFWRLVTLAAGWQAGFTDLEREDLEHLFRRARVLNRGWPMELADLGLIAIDTGLRRTGARFLRDSVDRCQSPGELARILKIAEFEGAGTVRRLIYGRLMDRFPKEVGFRVSLATYFAQAGRKRRALQLLGGSGVALPTDGLRLRAQVEVALGLLARARRTLVTLQAREPVDEVAETVWLAMAIRLFGRRCRSFIRRRVRGWFGSGGR